MKTLLFFNNLIKAIKTFPVCFFSLLALTFLVIWDDAWWLDSFYHVEECWIAVFLTLLLGLFWPLLSLHHSNWRSKKYLTINYALQIIALLVGWIYYYLLTNYNFIDAANTTQLLFLWVIPLAALWVILQSAFLLKVSEEDIRIDWSNIIKSLGFWFLAGLIVRWGLSWALASIEALFDIDFSYHWYTYFGAFSMILLAGSFVLNYYLISTEASAIILPSRIRKIFWSYIILPLAMIYLAIFIAYALKIAITWEWPRWVIVWLWCWYFMFWMVCYYLTYPEKTTFYEVFHKVLFASFLFIVLMMWCAILKRINQYWLTVNRYFVCAFVISIAIFSILALVLKRRRLLSFVSVFFAAVLVSFYAWPFNATSLSLSSQKTRLVSLLDKENIAIPLWDNSLSNLTWDTARLAAGIIDEIVDEYEVSAWSWNLIQTDSLTWNLRGYSLRYDIHSLLGLESYYPLSKEKYFSYRTNRDNVEFDINWYSKLYELSVYFSDAEADKNNIIKLPEHIWWELNISPYVNDIYNKKDSESNEYYMIEEPWKKYLLTSVSWKEKSDWSIIITWIYWYLLVK